MAEYKLKTTSVPVGTSLPCSPERILHTEKHNDGSLKVWYAEVKTND